MNQITFNKTKLFKKIILATLCWSVILLPSFLRADIISNAGEPVVGGEIVYIPFDDSVCSVEEIKEKHNKDDSKVKMGCVLIDKEAEEKIKKVPCENFSSHKAIFVKTDEKGFGSFVLPSELAESCSGTWFTLYQDSKAYNLLFRETAYEQPTFLEVILTICKDLIVNFWEFITSGISDSWGQDITFEVEKDGLVYYDLFSKSSPVCNPDDSFVRAQLNALNSTILSACDSSTRSAIKDLNVINFNYLEDFSEELSSANKGNFFWLNYKFYLTFLSQPLPTEMEFYSFPFGEVVFVDPVSKWPEASERQSNLVSEIKRIVSGPTGKSVVAYINNPLVSGVQYYNKETGSYYNTESSLDPDLAVNIVGFDDSISINNFKSSNPLPFRPGAFIVKTPLDVSAASPWNSENKGYIYISYQDKGLAQNTFNYFPNTNSREYINDMLWPGALLPKKYSVSEDKVVTQLILENCNYIQPSIKRIGFWVSFPNTVVTVKKPISDSEEIFFSAKFIDPGYYQRKLSRTISEEDIPKIVIEFTGSKIEDFISDKNFQNIEFSFKDEDSFDSDQYTNFFNKFEFVPYFSFNSNENSNDIVKPQVVQILDDNPQSLEEILSECQDLQSLLAKLNQGGHIKHIFDSSAWPIEKLLNLGLGLQGLSVSSAQGEEIKLVIENDSSPDNRMLLLSIKFSEGTNKNLEINDTRITNLDNMLGSSQSLDRIDQTYNVGELAVHSGPKFDSGPLFYVSITPGYSPEIKASIVPDHSQKHRKRSLSSSSSDQSEKNSLLGITLVSSKNAIIPKGPEVCYQDKCLLQAEIINNSADLVEVEAYVSRGEKYCIVPLFDDGSHGDQIANDSIYSAIYTGKPLEVGFNYLVKFQAEFKEVDSGTIKKQIGFPSNFYVINPAQDLVTKKISLTPGWNMVSLPVDPLNQDNLEDRSVKKASAVFPEAKSVWEYHHVYNESLQRRESKYISVLDKSSGVDKEVHLGGGYFVYMDMDSSQEISVSGLIYSGYLADLHPGWNLIGTIGQEDEVSKKAFEMFGGADLVYDYNPETKEYRLLYNGEVNEHLTEGRAVWVRVENEGSEKVIISN